MGKNIGQKEILEWFSQQDTSAAEELQHRFEKWAESNEEDGNDVDGRYWARCRLDLDEHGRLTAETQINAEPAPTNELDPGQL